MVWVQRYDWSTRPDIKRLGLEATTEPLHKAQPIACEYPSHSLLGFGYDSGLHGTGIAHREVTLPYWFLAVLLIGALTWVGSKTMAGLRDAPSVTDKQGDGS